MGSYKQGYPFNGDDHSLPQADSALLEAKYNQQLRDLKRRIVTNAEIRSEAMHFAIEILGSNAEQTPRLFTLAKSIENYLKGDLGCAKQGDTQQPELPYGTQ